MTPQTMGQADWYLGTSDAHILLKRNKMIKKGGGRLKKRRSISSEHNTRTQRLHEMEQIRMTAAKRGTM